jgi:twitching motility protein PilT
LKTADGKGRVAAHEILIGTSGISALIRENKTFQIASLMQSLSGIGMQTMDVALERLVAKGTVSADVALEKAIDKESFLKLMRQKNPDFAGELE